MVLKFYLKKKKQLYILEKFLILESRVFYNGKQKRKTNTDFARNEYVEMSKWTAKRLF